MHSYFPHQNYLIFKNIGVTIFLTMKINPYLPRTMIAHCRLCDNHHNFHLGSNANDLLTLTDLESYDLSCQEEYIDLKSVRLHYRLKNLASSDNDVAEFFTNNPNPPLVIYKKCKNSPIRAVYYFNDTFPMKKLKRLFSKLNIDLIAKNKGGQDE